MRKIIVSGSIGLGLWALCAVPSGAATLDDVMRELKSLRQENAAIRRELSRIRKSERAAPRQAARPRTPPVRNTSQTVRAEPETFSGGGVSPRSTYAPVRGGTYDWGGFYAGLNLGYGSGESVSRITGDTSNPLISFITGPQSSALAGLLGGLQLGYNFQNGPWVIGLEGDVQYANISGPQKANELAAILGPLSIDEVFNSSNGINSLGTIRGRLGYAFDRFLPYVTGGLAAGMSHSSGSESSHQLLDPTTTIFINETPGDRLHIGWAFGGGFEYGLSGGWSVKTEYLHVDLGEKSSVPDATSTKLKFDLVRAGVNYHF